MIDVQRLLESETTAFGDPAANWYGFLATCASMHQVPAGSLPNDNPKLAYLVRLGRDVKTWRRMRDKGALRDWVVHSDGRLYHPVMTETVLKLLSKSRAGRVAAQAREANRKQQVFETAEDEHNDRSSNGANSIQQKGNNIREEVTEEKVTEGNEELVQHVDEQHAPNHQDDDGRDSQGSLPIATKAPSKRKGSKQRSSISADWAVSEDGRKFALERRFVDRWIATNVARFIAYHEGKGSVMANWDAAWRSWVMNAVSFEQQPANRSARSVPGNVAAAYLLQNSVRD